MPLFNFNILKIFYYFYIQIHFAYQVLLATKNYLINLRKNKQPNRFRDIHGIIWVLAYCKIQSRQGKQFCMNTNRDSNTCSQKYDSNYRKEQRPIFCISTTDWRAVNENILLLIKYFLGVNLFIETLSNFSTFPEITQTYLKISFAAILCRYLKKKLMTIRIISKY